RLGVVDHPKIGLAPTHLFIDKAACAPIEIDAFLSKFTMLALKLVVQGLGDFEEVFLCFDHKPVCLDTKALQEWNERPEDLRNAASVGSRVNMDNPQTSHGLGH